MFYSVKCLIWVIKDTDSFYFDQKYKMTYIKSCHFSFSLMQLIHKVGKYDFVLGYATCIIRTKNVNKS